MTKAEAQKRIEKLSKEIDFHRYNYHVLDKETLAPSALDDLKAELFRLENEFPELINPNSPTQRVAGEVSEKFEKTTHSLPMISSATTTAPSASRTKGSSAKKWVS